MKKPTSTKRTRSARPLTRRELARTAGGWNIGADNELNKFFVLLPYLLNSDDGNFDENDLNN